MLHQKTIKRLEITSIITILAFIGYFFGDKVTFFDEKLTGSVYKIYDGDTITLHRDNKDYKIRFFGIDAIFGHEQGMWIQKWKSGGQNQMS